MSENSSKEYFQSSVFGKIVKVTLNDERILFGQLHCVDSSKNLVMLDAVEQIPSQYNAPISSHLNLFVRQGISATKYLDLPLETTENAELMEKINTEFAKDKFLVGQVIVPGKVIKKLEIQK